MTHAMSRRPLLLMALGVGLVAMAHRARGQSYVAFFRALELDDAQTVRELLARGFDANTPDERGQLPLFLALRGGAERVAEVLLNDPATAVDRANVLGETALMMAALRGQEGWVRRLVERGARINRDGWTPLHYAASGPSLDVVRFLVEHKAVLDARAPNGSTPLMVAAQHGPEDAVWLLVKQGATVGLRDAKGRSAADLARLAGRESLAESLDQLKR